VKTILISTLLAATSLGASAMNYGIDVHTNRAADSGLTRAAVIAELQRAKAAGEVAITEFEIRQAESKQLQSPSTLTREQVQQEVAALRDQGLLNIHGDH